MGLWGFYVVLIFFVTEFLNALYNSYYNHIQYITVLLLSYCIHHRYVHSHCQMFTSYCNKYHTLCCMYCMSSVGLFSNVIYCMIRNSTSYDTNGGPLAAVKEPPMARRSLRPVAYVLSNCEQATKSSRKRSPVFLLVTHGFLGEIQSSYG